MAHVSSLIAEDIVKYLQVHERKGLLRFITCGSVDDGKSTLIGRLLYESKMLFEDQLAALEADSKKVGTQGGELDFALLVDGLTAEREQGITIDVAYRFFSTDKRKFIVADTPGHEQYTRNMITGASTADVAVVMIDARKGVLTQTRRHSYLVSLIGIRKIVLAINKLDMAGYSREVFERIEADYRAFAAQIGLSDVAAIPMSALRGDNVTGPSDNTPWYRGPSLMEYLETVPVEAERAGPFRLPVQWVNRPNQDFRGFSGLVVGGSVRPGDAVVAMPSGKQSVVERVVTLGGDLDLAVAGESITVTLRDEIDVSRGDVLAAAGPGAPAAADLLEATVVWMTEEPLQPGRPYLLKLGSRTAGATLSAPRYKINVNTLERAPAESLALNEIGVCELTLDRLVAFDPYEQNRDMGGFIVIDRLTNNTIAAGMIRSGQRRRPDLRWPTVEVDRAARSALKGQQAAVLWFSGSRPDRSTSTASMVDKKLHSMGHHTYLLDAEALGHDLAHGDPEAAARRLLSLARLLADAGLIVLVQAPGPHPERCEILSSEPFSPSHEAASAVDTAGLPSIDAAEALVARLRDLGSLDAAGFTFGAGI